MFLVPRCLVPVTRRNQWIILFRNDFHAFEVSTSGPIVGFLEQPDDNLSPDWARLSLPPNQDGGDISKHCLPNLNDEQAVPIWNGQQGLYQDTLLGDGRMQNLEALDFNFTGQPPSSFDFYSLKMADLHSLSTTSDDFCMNLTPSPDTTSYPSTSSTESTLNTLGDFSDSSLSSPTNFGNVEVMGPPTPPVQFPHVQASPRTTEQPSGRFYCSVSGCMKHYKRIHELKRHQKLHSNVKLHECTISGCNRSRFGGFVRKDHLKQHMKKVHKMKL
ncbi:hypothetical protein ACMFMG_007878 [Clarireedia jacksonii]